MDSSRETVLGFRDHHAAPLDPLPNAHLRFKGRQRRGPVLAAGGRVGGKAVGWLCRES